MEVYLCGNEGIGLQAPERTVLIRRFAFVGAQINFDKS